MKLWLLVFGVLPGRHSDGFPVWCLTAVLSGDCGAYGHGMLIGGLAERTCYLRPCAVQESEVILHQKGYVCDKLPPSLPRDKMCIIQQPGTWLEVF